ncbi:MAG: hypothetical protein M3Z66_24205 [Chloroflexota bacterium]|nr:hypothetical protein [Chloroflexota bacterium]
MQIDPRLPPVSATRLASKARRLVHVWADIEGLRPHATDLLIRLAIALLVVMPITYGAVATRGDQVTVILFLVLNCIVTLGVANRSLDALGVGAIVSLATVISVAATSGLGLPVALVLNLGLSQGMSYAFANPDPGVVRSALFFVVLPVGGMSYAASYGIPDGRSGHLSMAALLVGVLLTFAFGLILFGLKRRHRTVVVLAVVGVPVTLLWAVSQPQDDARTRIILVLFIGLAVGTTLGYVFERWIIPFVRAFARIGPYLRPMYQPVSGFAIAYLAVMFLFAGYYAFMFRIHPGSTFTGVPPKAGIWDFMYLSVTTIFPLGYSSIRPATVATEVIASAEAIVGTAMLVVVFAALVAYLTPRFEKVTERVLDAKAMEIIRRLQARINSGNADERTRAADILEHVRTFIVDTSFTPEARAHTSEPFLDWLAAIPERERRRALQAFHDVVLD